MSEGSGAGSPAAGKPLKVHVLRCRSEACLGLLAYEETDQGFLLGQAILLAEKEGGKRYLPCPKCGGKNLVEEKDFDGKLRTHVVGFEPAS